MASRKEGKRTLIVARIREIVCSINDCNEKIVLGSDDERTHFRLERLAHELASKAAELMSLP